MIRNQKGLSLTEVLVVLGVFGVIGTIMGTFFISFVKFSNKQGDSIDAQMDRAVGTKYMWKDFQLSLPSFNAISMLDDSGKNFFSYLPGCPITSVSGAGMKRKLTIGKGAKQEITFIANDREFPMPILYYPVNAYDVGPTPTDPMAAATLNFVSLNKNDVVNKQQAKMWREGQLMRLYSPVWIKPAGDPCDQSVMPREPAYLGKVTAKRLLTMAGAVNFDYRNPMLPSKSYDNEDTFLRMLPPLGGAAPIVMLQPVTLVTYKFIPDHKQYEGKNVLTRTVSDGKSIRQEQIMVVGIEKLILTRDSLADSSVSVNIVIGK